MNSPREIELKLEVPEAALVLLTRTPLLRKSRVRSKRPASLISVYYDTDTGKLRKHGFTLRVRRIGKRHVQTIKRISGAGSAVMDRLEWEQEIEDGRPTFAMVRNTSLKSILSKKLQAKLKPLFETRVRRKVFSIQSGSSEIELSIDRGTVVAGWRSSPICEVELELKRGDATDLFKVAHAFAEQVPVQLSVVSKSERGYSLITDSKPSAVGAAPIAVSPNANFQAAFQTIARACLHQIVANQDLTRSGNSEGLHQTRVGLRRLRACISLFGAMLLDPASLTIKGELRWIAGELGPARELDVLIKGAAKPATVAGSQRPGVATLTRDLRRKRSEAFACVRLAMESRRFRLLVLDLAAWIEAGDWTRIDDDPAGANRGLPVVLAAAAQMNRRRNKIVKRGKKLDHLDPTSLHRIRIQAKKLRYAAEFFSATFPGKKATRRHKTFIKSLQWLQETLGDLNDISVHEGIAERLADVHSTGNKQKRRGSNKAFAAGRLSGHEEARIVSVLKDAKRAYEKFAKAKPFWP